MWASGHPVIVQILTGNYLLSHQHNNPGVGVGRARALPKALECHNYDVFGQAWNGTKTLADL